MITNRGLSNEESIEAALNQKLVKDINPNLLTMLKRMYGPLDEKETVLCERIPGVMKPDLKITYKGITNYVSVKSGHANTVHEEQVSTLIPFLRSVGVSEIDISNFLFLLYRDGTKDGTGEKSFEFLEHRLENKQLIKEFNERINGSKILVEKVIERCLFKGSKDSNIEAQYIYFGTVNFGVLCSKKQINKHISRRTWDYMDNPHIGPLQFRAHTLANKDNTEEQNKKRHQCDFWWARLREDLEYIEERYWG